jgi:hypothetical protein
MEVPGFVLAVRARCGYGSRFQRDTNAFGGEVHLVDSQVTFLGDERFEKGGVHAKFPIGIMPNGKLTLN